MRTPAHCERLLKRHPNLFMSFKTHRHSSRITQALDHGRLRAGWLNLVRLFPKRFVMGSDQFYQTPQSPLRFPDSMLGALAILRSLPPDLTALVGRKNPAALFRGTGG